MSEPQVFVGIDVSKAQLDVALRPTEDGWHVNHDGSSSVLVRWGEVEGYRGMIRHYDT